VWIESCISNDNSSDGFSVDDTVTGTCDVIGGEARRNGSHGYSLWAADDVSVVDATAEENTGKGIDINNGGTVLVEDCVANANGETGINLDWQDPDPLDLATVRSCVASGNGTVGGGNGIWVGNVAGQVTVSGTETNSNVYTGLRIDKTNGPVLVARATSSFNLEEGMKFDVDVGPVTVVDSEAEGNTDEGAIFFGETVDIENLNVRRSQFLSNGNGGLVFIGLGGSGDFRAQCNDLAGNAGAGMYLDNPVELDARKVWWGDASGPSGEGPGSGDAVISGPGTIFFEPWLEAPFGAPESTCEIFDTGFGSGTLEEWDFYIDGS
jgi:hypothetical protein